LRAIKKMIAFNWLSDLINNYMIYPLFCQEAGKSGVTSGRSPPGNSHSDEQVTKDERSFVFALWTIRP